MTRRDGNRGFRATVRPHASIEAVTDASPSHCSTSAKPIDTAGIGAFVDGLFSADRALPVVAITTSASTGRPHIDPNRVAQLLGNRASVVVLQTGEATWALSEAMPEMLDVYGGAVRIWWPGLTPDADPYGHPLLFARSREDGEQVLKRVLGAIKPLARPVPDAWQRVFEAYQVGDVVWGLVQNIKPFGVFVELLPGAVGLVHKSEVDWTRGRDPGEFVKPGEQVKVQILRIDEAARKADLSIKRAYTREPKPPLAAEPGGRPLITDSPAPLSEPAATGGRTERDRVDSQQEIEALREDRSNVLRRLRDVQKELRSATDRIAYLERQGQADPLSSEPAFLQSVRMAYARLFSEDERQVYPLRRMLVGPAFLDRLRNINGIATEKVIDVCAQVAANRAHEIPSREVHRLRKGEKGASYVRRKRDGALAWRCSLQDGSPAARRLHWWAVAGQGGETIEFASVGVHDDYSIPD